MNKKYLIVFIIIFFSKFTLSQDIEIIANNGKYIVDENLQLIVCNKDIIEFDNLININSLIIDLNGNIYEFNNIPSKLEYGELYHVTFNSKVYQLYFSQLPLIIINTSQDIQDEPKILANFLLTAATDSEPIISYCGIEYRGGTSQSYPKKSFAIELWEDETGEDKNKTSLLNMRDDDDWILLAMYNEPLRIRNVISHKLWTEIHTPYYIDEEEDAMSGIRTEYIELTINNEYLGVYALCEQIDKKQLQLKNYKTSISGELYKGVNWGASTFTALPPYNNNSRMWSGFEMRYPKEADITDWDNIYNFVKFVINSTNEEFSRSIKSKFVIENAIDYFIFLNLIRATDNTGKNIFVAKYKENEPYFYIPWDLDGTFGIIWNGEQEDIYNDILTNGFYNRLLNMNNELFNEIASNRWNELRSNIFEVNYLINTIYHSYNFLLSNGVYKRESLKWGDESIDLANLDYIDGWLNNRLDFLDVYFGSTILKTKDNLNIHEEFKIYPNPVISAFKIYTSNELVFYNIYDINGILLKNGSTQNNEEINIENFSDGIYFLKVTNSKKSQTTNFKIIKQ